jgi:hypothetical protein
LNRVADHHAALREEGRDGGGRGKRR